MDGGPIRELEYGRREVRGADYLVGTCGTGPAVLLLHGFPQTHYCWRHVVPALSHEHTVVVTDLRGYGATTAPPGGPHGQGFSKREMALDLVQMMDALEFGTFAVVGHDRGARVAYRLALDHPERVERLAVLNIVPTLDQFERMSGGPSLGYWPWFLLAQPEPFPERLIAADREHFLRFIFDSWTDNRDAVDARAFAEYLAALNEPTIAAMCADYRASFWLDRDDDGADRRSRRRIECPVLVATGEAESQLADAAQIWSSWAPNLRARTLPGGHFIPEEAAEQLAEALLDFLGAPPSSPSFA
jgi:haloacetate dehalogenase